MIFFRYLQFYLLNLFATGFTSKSESPDSGSFSSIVVKPPKILLPTKRQINKLVKLIKDSEKPILLIGSQAVLPPVSAKETAANVNNNEVS
ncbi:unnamed protein product [Trichobilharzia regenti]|nr:unnamed protein product [Trichobilharzia regenti]